MKESAPQTRWGSNTRKESSKGAQESILNAARHCYQHKGIARTTIEDIAHQASISRRTIYRYFPNKQQIIQAVVDEQAEAFFEGMLQTVEAYSNSFCELLEHCLLYTIECGPKASGHQLLLGEDNAAASSQYYFNSQQSYHYWEKVLRNPFDKAVENEEITRDLCFDDLISWCGRIIFSYIQFPESKENTERQIRQFLIKHLATNN